MRTFAPIIALTLPFTLAACGGSTPPARSAADAPGELVFSDVGGCTQRNLEVANVLEITPGSLPWQYIVSAESTISCEPQRVFISLGEGASVVLGSFADPDGTMAVVVGPAFVGGVLTDVQSEDPSAALENERTSVLGESGTIGNCGTIRWRTNGQPVRTETCAGIRTVAGASHFVLASVTDTDENWAALDQSPDQLLGALVDGLVLR